MIEILISNALGLAFGIGASLLIGLAIARAWRLVKGKKDKETEWFIIQFWPLVLGSFLFLLPLYLLSRLFGGGGKD